MLKSDADLPIHAVLPQLKAALELPLYRAVLTAAPGAGKSTYAPLALLSADWAQDKQLILLEPRRLAALRLARRLAELLGEEPGQTVGYAMRMEGKTSAQTRLLVMTEGSFTRMILDRPELEGIAAIIFDEFHERSLDADFGLALALDVADSLRPDLRLLIMSATLDTERAAALLGGEGAPAPIITAAGRSFPVELIYQPRALSRQTGRPQRPEEAAAKAVLRALDLGQGGILVFLPGQAEIKRTEALLAEALAGRDEIILAPLYGALPFSAQQKAIEPAPKGKRKIVLATSIAESALTIEDIRLVVDSGLARQPVYDAASGIMQLQTVKASRASADQRAGRAGRLAPGIALRLWDERGNNALPAFQPAEILAADQRALALDCADFGILDCNNLRLLDAPPAAALAQAKQNLRGLGGLNDKGQITPFGRALRRIGGPADIAAMILRAAQAGAAAAKQAARLSLLLTEAGLGGSAVDLDIKLENLAKDSSPRAVKAKSLAERLAKQALAAAQTLPKAANGAERAPAGNCGLSAGALLAASFPDRAARLRPAAAAGASSGMRAKAETASYILANGRGAFLDKTCSLYGKQWLICAELTGGGAESRIRAAAELKPETAQQLIEAQAETQETVFFDAPSRSLRCRREKRLGAIELESRPMPAPAGEAARQGWLAAIREYGLDILPWDKAARNLQARLNFLHFTAGAGWPDASDAALAAGLEDWLLPFLPGEASLAGMSGFLTQALAALPGYERARQIDSLAPSHFTVPSGSNLPIRYEGAAAILSARAQELFGLQQQPKIAGGAALLTLELLTPAGRPMQITRDIAGFWQGAWREAAAELRGRYPKHFWPDNPAEAAPAARAKPRRLARES